MNGAQYLYSPCILFSAKIIIGISTMAPHIHARNLWGSQNGLSFKYERLFLSHADNGNLLKWLTERLAGMSASAPYSIATMPTIDSDVNGSCSCIRDTFFNSQKYRYSFGTFCRSKGRFSLMSARQVPQCGPVSRR